MKALKENLEAYIKMLERNIDELAEKDEDYVDIKIDVLDEVIDWLQVLIDAESWREFRNK